MSARPWTDSEIDELYRLQPISNIPAIAKALRRSYNSVWARMILLGLHTPVRKESSREIVDSVSLVSTSRTPRDPNDASPFLDAINKRRRFAENFEFYCDKCDKGFHIEPLKRRGKKLCAACYVDGNRFIRAATQIHRGEPVRP